MEINTFIRDKVKNAVLQASTTFREDQFYAYKKALTNETDERALWFLELLIQNAQMAHKNKVPLCDDTGTPHILLEIGADTVLPGNFIKEVQIGIEDGLRKLPGRPMAVKGNDVQRIEQKKGLDKDPGKVVPTSLILDNMEGEGVKIHVLLLGGGPEIRSRTYRVFHKRDHRKVFEEVITWMRSELPQLGCTPCIPAVGIGRTHFEATSLMIKAMAYGNLKKQSELEKKITKSFNLTGIGVLGVGGSVTALGSMIKIGPQRASGVRIVCVRPACCVEPRRSSIYIPSEFLE